MGERVLTNDMLAQGIGVPEKTVRRWRLGSNTPKPFMVHRLAAFFHVQPGHFMVELEEEAA